MFSTVVSFAIVAGLLTVVPGLDTSLVLRAAIVQGRRAAVTTAIGVNTGLLVWGVAASVGVSELLTASRLAFDVVRLAGAAYLLGLGATMLWRSFKPTPQSPDGDSDHRLVSSPRRILVRGFTANLLNPKIGVFYVAAIPQFLPAHSSHLLMGVILALVHVAEGMTWYTVLIYFAHRFRTRLRTTLQRVVEWVTGAVLVGFGARLALSRI